MPSRDISACDIRLQKAWPLLRDDFLRHFPGWDMLLSCTSRSVGEQFDLFKKGRVPGAGGMWLVNDPSQVVTEIDGVSKKSLHNLVPALAFDVMLKSPDGALDWDFSNDAWQSLPRLAAGRGLVNGGSWLHFKDWPHFEVPREEAS